MPRIRRTGTQREAIVRSRMVPGAGGGRHAAVAAEPQRPAPPTTLPSGTGASVIVASVWSTGRERLAAHFVCDGVNDEVQIQAALNECAANFGGEVLLLGSYFALGANLSVPDWCWLRGTGKAATYVEAAAGITAITLSGAWAGLSDLNVYGLGATGVGRFNIAGSSGIGVLITGNRSWVHDVLVGRFVTGFFVDAQQITLHHNHVEDCDRAFFGDSNALWAQYLDNRIEECDVGFFASSGSALATISRNWCQNTTDGIDWSGDGSVFDDNYLECDDGYGIRLRNGSDHCRVSRNWVEDSLIAYSFENNHIVGNGNGLRTCAQHGVVLAANNCVFDDGFIYGGGSNLSGGLPAYDAINVTADNCRVVGNEIEPSTNARTGIRIEATADKTRVALNRKTGGGGAVLNDLGTNTRKNFDGSANDWNVAV